MRKLFITILILISVFVIGTIALNYYFKNKIESFLSSGLPEDMTLNYDNIDVHSWEGTVTVDNIQLNLKNPEDSISKAQIKTQELKLKDLDYWDYFTKDKIHFELIELGESSVIYHQQKKKDTNQVSQNNNDSKFKKSIQINRLKLAKTSLKVLKNGADSLLINMPQTVISIENIETNKEKLKQQIPFDYSSIHIESDSIFYRLNAYDNLYVDKFSLDDSTLILNNTQIKTRYSQIELSQQISKERDHVDLNIPKIAFKSFNIKAENSTVSAQASQMDITQPQFKIFRDKLVADDPTFKPLYSKSLRDLPFELMIDNAQIKGASIEYEEKVKADNQAGKLSFKNLQATIKNLGNTYALGEKMTSIQVNALFMEKSPIEVDWSFDVQNKNDQFRFKADVGELPVTALNSFTEPNLNVKLTGALHKAYFDISGDNTSSHINMKMNYDDFKIAVLNDKKEKKKWLISTLANLFVSKDSEEKGSDSFRSGEGTAERDTSKSIFNYLWLNVKQGLLSVLTGDGESS
ncbi:hypothetical protein ACH3O9_03695 [Leeuwenhoekiella sp. A16]|uniref:hypothetical protein n=1 Tax=unclassified Leeuwenhoekiella TaxID=2615029 RepID=UPI003A7FEDC2